jgi:hypothetical protein
MQCQECKWFLISPNDYYGVCKRYPENQNKNKTDFCGEFDARPDIPVAIEEYQAPITIAIEETKPKRGRKPKNVD